MVWGGTVNPFIELYREPVAALTDAAWICVLLAALAATWWALGRNLLWLDKRWQQGWRYLPPFWTAVRMVAVLVVAAVDLWLVAGIVAVVAG